MRTKLFLSYSRGDAPWRDRFLLHLKTMVSFQDGLWVDKDSIEEGADWEDQLKDALPNSKCALVLLTPHYLEKGSFANDRELDLLVRERANGLTLLPVLVEPCVFQDRPGLSKVEFLRWRNSSKRIETGDGSREVMRALSEAGEDDPVSSGDSAVDRAVMEVCEHVKKAFGIVGQITVPQREQLSDLTSSAVERAVAQATAASGGALVFEKEPIHSGDFTVVYRGEVDGQRVAVKAMPTDAWRNRVRTALEHAKTTSRQLRDSAFIRVEYSIPGAEVHALVMEYVDWPTLESLVAQRGSLPPQQVATILSQIARAQHEAHQKGLPIGALSPSGIYVSDRTEVRLAPFRIEGQLARGLSMSTGQLMNWDVLSMLTPEIYAGSQPITAEELGRHEQYYLGLLGLELLNGRRPVDVTCFKDLDKKAAFFDDPRASFTDDAAAHGWAEESPALAFVLSKMLSRNPVDRLESADEASIELRRVAEGRLPNCVRRCLELDYRQLVNDGFTASFYDRLFSRRPELRAKFSNQQAQAHALREAVRDLVEFRPDDGAARFLEHAESHRAKGITPDDIEAFRTAFVDEIIGKSQQLAGAVSSRSRADAWNAVLKLGLGLMQQSVAGSADSAYV